MSISSLLNKFRWQGSEHVYHVPWLRNRIQYTADPDTVRAYLKQGKFTRSQMSMDLLTRFHLSNNSIVVSKDEHAHALRKILLACTPEPEQFPVIADDLVDQALTKCIPDGGEYTLHLSQTLIREVYFSLLKNLLGIHIPAPLEEYIRSINFQPGTRPMHLDGVMYAFGLQLPGFGPMRALINLLFFKRDHSMRRVALGLERQLFELAIPKPGSWYAALLEMKKNGELSNAQFRGELTSILVSAFALSSAMSSMILCLAACQGYTHKIRHDENMAKCFVNEVLRLYPPFRQFGYEEKGIWKKTRKSRPPVTDFMVLVFGLHRNKHVWDDAALFNPERFMAPAMAGGCKFLPFGMGPRSCVGRVYAMNMLVAVLNRLCSEECPLAFELPSDRIRTEAGLPIGASGRLVSFPVDDRVTLSKKTQHASSPVNKQQPSIWHREQNP